MKPWVILAGIALIAAALVVYLRTPAGEDVERLYQVATKERPVIVEALGECADLVKQFAERKPMERKKGDLDDLRRRLEGLETAANEARDGASAPIAERRRRLDEIEEGFYQLRTDATDLRARLREMRNYDEQLKPRISELGQLTKKLAEAQAAAADPEFQQRVDALLKEGRTFRTMAEDALKRLSVKILDGRTMAQTALNELDDLNRRMKELLERHRGSPAAAAAGGGD